MENEDYQKTNRQTVQTPKSKKAFWCEWCDANLVRVNEKCSVCGKRLKTKALKRDT